MADFSGSTGELRRALVRLLEADDFEQRTGELSRFDPRRAVSPRIGLLCATAELPRWRAVRALGLLVAGLAQSDAESARIVMRRLIWSLNDESGGIGWGAPEAMGEIMAQSERMAFEYAPILVSYIREEGNPLENELLERGVLWGIGRLAQVRPELVRPWGEDIALRVASGDAAQRGLAAWCLGILGAHRWREALEALGADESAVVLFADGKVAQHRVCDLAAGALQADRLRKGHGG